MNYYNKLEHKELTFDFMLNEDVDAGTRAYIEGNGSRIFVMPGLRAVNIFKYVKSLKEFYKSHNYNIIHGHVANSAVFYLGYVRKTVPVRIIHSHNTKASDVFWKRIRNWVLTRFLRRVANRFAACSETAAIFLFGRVDNVKIVSNAIEINKFLYYSDVRKRIRRELSVEDKIIIGHVGRFSAQKNHKFLIECFHELHNNNPDTVLLLIGSGELYEDIVHDVKKRDLSEAVIFAGSADNVCEYLNAMDVFILPSFFEGLPLTGIEAQVNGLPCVFSDMITREVQISDSAFFLPLGDAGVWADEVIRAAGCGRSEAGDMRMAAFDIDVQVKELAAYYKELLPKGSI